MSAIGPKNQYGTADPLFPTCQLALDVSSSDANLATAFNAGYARWLYIGSGGALVAQMQGDAAPVVRAHVVAGDRLPGCWILVQSAGTTASGIIAEF